MQAIIVVMWNDLEALMRLFSKIALVSVAVLGMGLATPEAKAGGIFLDGPHLSISIGDRHKKKRRWRHRHSNRCDHGYRGRYRNYDRWNDRYWGNNYYNDYRPRDYRYRNNSYYGNGYRYRDNYYGDRRRGNRICPTYGFSWTWYSDRDCYRHKDHFHCTD